MSHEEKFSELTKLLTPPELDDFIHIVDKSDTTQSPQGSSKRVDVELVKEKINEDDYETISVGKKGNVGDNAYLWYAGVETKDGQGPSWSVDLLITIIEWSVKENDLEVGDFEFFANGVSIGTVSITEDATGTINTPGITLPKNSQIGVQWQGPGIKEAILNMQVKEV
jgi:hypothetical protein